MRSTLASRMWMAPILLAAAIACAPTARADDLRLVLDTVRVEEMRERSGDRPYFASIVFRSTLHQRGSTSVWIVESEPHDWVSKPLWHRGRPDGHLGNGDAANIPFWMGNLEWRAVDVKAAGPAAATAEILGAIIVGLDNNNTPPHVITGVLESAVPGLRAFLARFVESGRIVREADQIQAQLQQALQEILRALVSENLPTLLAQLTVGSAFNPDQITGVQVVLIPAVEGGSAVRSAASHDGLPGGPVTVGQLQTPPRPGAHTFEFAGSRARYSVRGRLERSDRRSAMEVRQVRFELFTGADDLHRDSRAFAVVETARGTFQAPIDNIGVLSPRTRHVVTLLLGSALPRRDIQRIGLRMHPPPFPDVWEVDGLRVVAVGDLGVETLYARGGRRTNQFGTGSETWFEVVGPEEAPTSAGTPAMVDRLRVTVHTGTDDLRGGNDNADLVVHVRGRTPQVVPFNGRARLPDLTSRTIDVYLGSAVPLSDLEALEIRTSLSGGGGGDNWNVSRLRIDAIGPSSPRVLLEKEGRPLFRFTGASRSHRWPLTPP